MAQSFPHVDVDMNRLVGTPEQTATEEGGQQQHAVVPLCLTTSHVDLVQEPVDIQERAGEFVEDKCGGVEVDEWPLWTSQHRVQTSNTGSRNTYKTQRKHPQSTHTMENHPNTEGLDMRRTDYQVIRKVSRSQRLY